MINRIKLYKKFLQREQNYRINGCIGLIFSLYTICLLFYIHPLSQDFIRVPNGGVSSVAICPRIEKTTSHDANNKQLNFFDGLKLYYYGGRSPELMTQLVCEKLVAPEPHVCDFSNKFVDIISQTHVQQNGLIDRQFLSIDIMYINDQWMRLVYIFLSARVMSFPKSDLSLPGYSFD